jgi:demethylspheroidene O-methyltransferase
MLQPAEPAAAMASAPVQPSWLDRGLALRDRLLASPRFQRWAAAMPFTRPIARRHARALFDLCAGFVYSQVLLACVRLRLFEILAERPQSLAVLAERLALPLDAAARLLTAAAALQLVERRGHDRYGLGVLGAALRGNPGVAAMIEHHSLLYADLRDPVALLRGALADSELARYWAYAGAAQPAGLPAERVAAYSALMTASQPMIAGEILAAYSLRQHRCLLDIGGGEGAFLAAAAASAPNLRLLLFDLPAVVARARQRFEAAGLSTRATVVGGNFFADPLPQGADVVSLVRVIHDHNDDAVLALLRAVRRILPADGALLLAEPLSDTRGAEPVGDAYFGFYLFAMGRGRARSAAELMNLMREAGFGQFRLVATHMPLQTSLIVARPDANWQP